MTSTKIGPKTKRGGYSTKRSTQRGGNQQKILSKPKTRLCEKKKKENLYWDESELRRVRTKKDRTLPSSRCEGEREKKGADLAEGEGEEQTYVHTANVTCAKVREKESVLFHLNLEGIQTRKGYDPTSDI